MYYSVIRLCTKTYFTIIPHNCTKFFIRSKYTEFECCNAKFWSVIILIKFLPSS